MRVVDPALSFTEFFVYVVIAAFAAGSLFSDHELDLVRLLDSVVAPPTVPGGGLGARRNEPDARLYQGRGPLRARLCCVRAAIHQEEVLL